MSEQAFGMVEMAGYALAVVLVVAAIVYFVTHHIREVRGELTGATARAAIQEMREKGVSHLAAAALATPGEGSPGSTEAPSGTLHVRFFGRRTTGMAGTAGKGGTGVQALDAPSEAGTTLLEDVAVEPGCKTGERIVQDSSEAGTVLLHSGDSMDSESMTTLLGGEDGDVPEQR